MPKLIRLCAVLIAVAAVPVAGAQAAGSSAAAVPSAKTLYSDGPSGRYLLDGTWLRRLDPSSVGVAAGWQKQTSSAGWTPTAVPNAWNAGDDSMASYLGSVGWYRKDFRIPTGAPDRSWVIRFEEVNYSATVWLNGVQIGAHAGAFEPFELRLPRSLVKAGADNSLVLRIDSRRTVNDIPPARNDEFGQPQGGWWNYAGILREVYLRAVDQIDITSVNVRPDLRCPSCAVDVNYQVKVSNLGSATRTVTVAGRFGPTRLTVGKATLSPGASATLTKKLTIAKPKLWSPARPYLYDASLDAARECYPTKALMITEYGAEASAAGQPEDRGTWPFANELIKFHLDVYATKPWLSGSLYWALQEFWVRPGWEGGNPFAAPPLHQKGLVSFAGAKKPIFAPVARAFKAVKQVGSTR